MPRRHVIGRGGRIALRDDEKKSVAQAETLLLEETGKRISLVGIKLRPMAWVKESKVLSDRYMYLCEYESLFRQLEDDGFGRSESRVSLRDFFEVDAKHIVLATLTALAREKQIKLDVLQKAVKELGINPEKANPANT